VICVTREFSKTTLGILQNIGDGNLSSRPHFIRFIFAATIVNIVETFWNRSGFDVHNRLICSKLHVWIILTMRKHHDKNGQRHCSKTTLRGTEALHTREFLKFEQIEELEKALRLLQ
jgi:hypothetical protein